MAHRKSITERGMSEIKGEREFTSRAAGNAQQHETCSVSQRFWQLASRASESAGEHQECIP